MSFFRKHKKQSVRVKVYLDGDQCQLKDMRVKKVHERIQAHVMNRFANASDITYDVIQVVQKSSAGFDKNVQAMQKCGEILPGMQCKEQESKYEGDQAVDKEIKDLITAELNNLDRNYALVCVVSNDKDFDDMKEKFEVQRPTMTGKIRRIIANL